MNILLQRRYRSDAGRQRTSAAAREIENRDFNFRSLAGAAEGTHLLFSFLCDYINDLFNHYARKHIQYIYYIQYVS